MKKVSFVLFLSMFVILALVTISYSEYQNILVSPTILNFGAIKVGRSSAPSVITISNTGTGIPTYIRHDLVGCSELFPKCK